MSVICFRSILKCIVDSEMVNKQTRLVSYIFLILKVEIKYHSEKMHIYLFIVRGVVWVGLNYQCVNYFEGSLFVALCYGKSVIVHMFWPWFWLLSSDEWVYKFYFENYSVFTDCYHRMVNKSSWKIIYTHSFYTIYSYYQFASFFIVSTASS